MDIEGISNLPHLLIARISLERSNREQSSRMGQDGPHVPTPQQWTDESKTLHTAAYIKE